MEATRASLERIAASDLNAFVTVTESAALDRATVAEREISAGRYRGPLHGVPLAVKDIFNTEGVRTTMGSSFFADHVPDHSATAVRRLEAAGAVIVGKTTTHEFAYGGTGDRSLSGASRNPTDPTRITGGSSGGSAAAVAAGLVWGAVGTDSGGSVRIPAALCGLVGMKPTFGRISTYGVFPLAPTMDHVGPLTRTVADNVAMLSALVGHDPLDPYSVDQDAEDFSRSVARGVRGGTIGIPSEYYFEQIDSEVRERVQAAAATFRSLGAQVREVHIPRLHETFQAQRLTLAAEAFAVHAERLATDPERFDSRVRERLLRGEPLRAHQYVLAQQLRQQARTDFGHALRELDVLLTPTTPVAATPLGAEEVTVEGQSVKVSAVIARLTAPANLIGIPSLSIPCGTTRTGLPIGVQLMAGAFDESTLYRYAMAYEQARDQSAKAELEQEISS